MGLGPHLKAIVSALRALEVVTQRLSRALDAADREARRIKDEYVSVEHLLLGILEQGSAASRVLQAHGVTRDSLLAALTQVRGNQRVTSATPEGATRRWRSTGGTWSPTPAAARSTR